jgi:hypothetical protein
MTSKSHLHLLLSCNITVPESCYLKFTFAFPYSPQKQRPFLKGPETASPPTDLFFFADVFLLVTKLFHIYSKQDA